MSQSEAPLYDHAQDLELEIERPLPDWGGDEVFATVPRRRRVAHTSPRANGAGPSTLDERRHFGQSHAAVAPDPPAEADRGRDSSRDASEMSPEYEVGPGGRRTVVITGRPFDHPRRRPSRTVEERIAHRPDRVAAWAVGLGFGLVIAAIATAPL